MRAPVEMKSVGKEAATLSRLATLRIFHVFLQILGLSRESQKFASTTIDQINLRLSK